MTDYFKDDEYWKKHINDEINIDIWIDDYKEYFSNKGKCLDLGCGTGEFTKKLIGLGYDVISSDISDIALNKVKDFNNNIVKLDMREKFPFQDSSFDLVFANLSIHYFNEEETKKLLLEINRILKTNGLFIGSVNGKEEYNKIKDTALKLEDNYYFNKKKYIRLFDDQELEKYMNNFDIKKIEKKTTIRFNKEKSFWIFICKKNIIGR